MKETYRIRKENVWRLEEKVAKLNRKAERLGCAPITLSLGKIEEVVRKDEITGASWVEVFLDVTVEGEAPKLSDDWTFVATLVPTPDGNVLLSAPGEEAPTEYREADFRCDHCGYLRYRKETFVVRNEAGEHKQVGRNCLSDFLGGVSPHKLAQKYTWWTKVIRLGDDELFDFSNRPRIELHDSADYLAVVAAAIREIGWKSRSAAREEHGAVASADLAWDWLRGVRSIRKLFDVTEEDRETAESALTWARENLVDAERFDSDYHYNLSVTAANDYFRVDKQDGLLASLLPFWYRETTKERERAERPVSEWVGEVKERREFENLECVFELAIDSYYGTKWLQKFRDADGNVLVWWNSSSTSYKIEVGGIYSGKATIKAHEEYKGEKQTVITRANFEEVGRVDDADDTPGD